MYILRRSKMQKKIRKFIGSAPPPKADTRIATWKGCKLLYVRNPKCANTSIINSIEGVQRSRINRTDIKNINGDWISFSFVRNPWARLVSTFRNKAIADSDSSKMIRGDFQRFLDVGVPIDTNMTFEQFCEIVCDIPDSRTEKHLRSQSSVLMHNGTPIVSYIGKVENMENDWKNLMELAGLNAKILHMNETRHNHYSSYFTDRYLIDLVGDRYANDIRYFDYDFEKDSRPHR